RIGPETDVADVAHTLATGRVALPARLAVAADSVPALVDRLRDGTGVVRRQPPKDGAAPLVFAFPGQGSQYPGMAVPLAEALPGFQAGVDKCIDCFDADLAGRLRRSLFDPAYPRAELDATELAQPALFAVEYAAAAALIDLDLVPAAVLGHSLGEIVAACIAGVLDLGDAARFVATRGRAMQACPPGAMLAIGASEPRVMELVAEAHLPLELAAVNGTDICVLAGSAEAIEMIRRSVPPDLFTTVLRTIHAFHSALVELALPALREQLAC